MNVISRPTQHLEIFFAVTMGSIYKVTCRGGKPNAVKCYVHNAALSENESSLLYRGNMVGVGNQIRFFHSDSGTGPITDEYVVRPREITDLNTYSRGERDSTLPVVGLFLEEAGARAASTKGHFLQDNKCMTLEVIREIGLTHPYFAVSCEEATRLVDPIEWLPPEHVAQLPEYRYPRT